MTEVAFTIGFVRVTLSALRLKLSDRLNQERCGWRDK
jgi:hypothetical protein